MCKVKIVQMQTCKPPIEYTLFKSEDMALVLEAFASAQDVLTDACAANLTLK